MHELNIICSKEKWLLEIWELKLWWMIYVFKDRRWSEKFSGPENQEVNSYFYHSHLCLKIQKWKHHQMQIWGSGYIYLTKPFSILFTVFRSFGKTTSYVSRGLCPFGQYNSSMLEKFKFISLLKLFKNEKWKMENEKWSLIQWSMPAK